MVDVKGKIKKYSWVAWIDDNASADNRDHSHLPLPPAKRQRLISSSANLSPEQPVEFLIQAPDDVDKNAPENDAPQDFLFDFTSNANDLTPSESHSSPLSSLRTTPDISNTTPAKSSEFSTPQARPITRSQKTPTTKLFSLLASANSSEIPEPKNYKQATSKQNPHHDDWKAAI